MNFLSTPVCLRGFCPAPFAQAQPKLTASSKKCSGFGLDPNFKDTLITQVQAEGTAKTEEATSQQPENAQLQRAEDTVCTGRPPCLPSHCPRGSGRSLGASASVPPFPAPVHQPDLRLASGYSHCSGPHAGPHHRPPRFYKDVRGAPASSPVPHPPAPRTHREVRPELRGSAP